MKSIFAYPTLRVFAAISSCFLGREPVLADGCPAPSFSAARTFGAGLVPVSVAVGDFNLDGDLDLATANSFGGAGNVSVLLGNGDGTFQIAVNYPAVVNPYSVGTGDLNGDGKPDLAVVSLYSTNVAVLLGNGDGTFQTAASHGVEGKHSFVAFDDFNGDGKTDLVVANANLNNVSVLVGQGNGNFEAPVSYAVGASPWSVTGADLNADGKSDLIVANEGSGDVSVLLGNGDGTFKSAKNYGSGSSSRSVVVNDFNLDGIPDLAAANEGSPPNATDGSVSVLLGNGDGTFRSAVSFPAGSHSYSIATGEFNGDGKADLAVANYGSTNVAVLLGNGDGTFQTAVDYSSLAGTWALTVGDFNGDGRPDLAVSNAESANVSVLLNTCISAGVQLGAVRTNSVVTIFWPFPSTGFVLESTTNLGSTNWQSAGETVLTNNNRLEVTVPFDQAQRYIRLRKT